MAVEIRVGPPQLAIHHGYTVCLTEPDGQIGGLTDKGLYFFDTRVINAYAIYANGQTWDLLNSGAPAHYGAKVFLTNRGFASEGGDVPARTLALVLTRVVDGGMHERFELTNNGRAPVHFNLELALRSDFSDIFEVKAGRNIRRGRISTAWSDSAAALTTAYHNGPFSRTLEIRCRPDFSAPGSPISGAPVTYANGRLSFALALHPGETWTGSLLYDLFDGDRRYPAPELCQLEPTSPQGRALADWRGRCLRIETSATGFRQLFDQAVEDLAALRLPVEHGDTTAYVPAAGLPWFVALFGRDPLIVSLQAMILNADLARATLDILAAWQARENDPYRDAEPGKILHELRRGELAALKLIPHTPYYGTADATPLFLILLHALWRATGDPALLETHRATAERCLSWIDDYGDRDGDGFQEYGTRSGDGYENVGWKDSGEAVVDVDGSAVTKPKALCELQGYVYAAWRGMAEAYAATGNPARAAELSAKADALFEHFNAVFWNEAEGFYAYCLDGDKKPVWTVASNPGHLLWSGIVPADRATRVVSRLTQPDMWSGWGIRTLTRHNPTYNPYSYQNGSVWPHDNSLIALGFARYGFTDEANRVAADVTAAASFFAQRQLPELYSGTQRDSTSFPVQYLGANVPQAWAAASVFALLQAMLGLDLDAPRDRLTLSPNLPDWLPDLTLYDLRLGRHTFDITFTRTPTGTTTTTVLRGDPTLLHFNSPTQPAIIDRPAA